MVAAGATYQQKWLLQHHVDPNSPASLKRDVVSDAIGVILRSSFIFLQSRTGIGQNDWVRRIPYSSKTACCIWNACCCWGTHVQLQQIVTLFGPLISLTRCQTFSASVLMLFSDMLLPVEAT